VETENEDKTETTGSVAPEGAPAAAEAPVEVDPLEAARAEAAQFKERMLRTAADFDNFRKRARREAEDALRKGRDGLLRELLPVFDNIERAVAHSALTKGEASGTEADVKSLSEGLNLVIRQFRDTLSRIGVERVDSVGKPFDPSLHEAIQHLETTEHPPGHVAAEVQAAYREGDRLVRPAMVVVAKAPTEAAPAQATTESGEGAS
jgi:molecular chaperone GrpE